MTRGQRRALHAYECVERVPRSEREDYKVMVNALGSNMLRSGLAAAMAFLERDLQRRAAAGRLLDDLATAAIPGFAAARTGREIPRTVRDLDVQTYILATRELLSVVVWFRRAVQATFHPEQAEPEGSE